MARAPTSSEHRSALLAASRLSRQRPRTSSTPASYARTPTATPSEMPSSPRCDATPPRSGVRGRVGTRDVVRIYPGEMPTLPFRMGRLDHVHIRVPDRAEAARWYSEHLGFEPVGAYEFWATGFEG